MKTMILLGALATLTAQQPQETKPIPNDSVLVDTRGCLKGRVFTATGGAENEGVTRGPDVTGRHFRVAGKKDVMDLVKKYDGQFVQVVGIVRKTDLNDQGVGMNVGRGRVTIGPGSGDPTRVNSANMTTSNPVMDLTGVTFLLERCPIK